MKIKNLSHHPNALCQNSTTSIAQKAQVSSSCVIKNIQESFAKSLSELTAETKGGLGFSASTNQAELLTQVKQKVDDKCQNVSTTNTMDIENLDITSCDFYGIQEGNAKAVCEIGVLQSMVSEASGKASAKTEGMTLASFLGGDLGGIVVIAIVAIGGFLAYKYFGGGGDDDDSEEEEESPEPKPKQKKLKANEKDILKSETGEKSEKSDDGEESTDGDDKKKFRGGFISLYDLSEPNKFIADLKTKHSIIIFIILFFMIIFIALSKKKDNYVTQDELNALKNNMMETKRIAKIY
jgi:hypothetical protein